MRYRRPKECVADMIDLYYCRNIDCKTPIRTVSAGGNPPNHCGIPAQKFNTVSRSHWKNICRKTSEAIEKIRARQLANKLLDERAV